MEDKRSHSLVVDVDVAGGRGGSVTVAAVSAPASRREPEPR